MCANKRVRDEPVIENRVEWKKEKKTAEEIKKITTILLFASMYCELYYRRMYGQIRLAYTWTNPQSHIPVYAINRIVRRIEREGKTEENYCTMQCIGLAAIVWAKELYSWFGCWVQFTEHIAQVTCNEARTKKIERTHEKKKQMNKRTNQKMTRKKEEKKRTTTSTTTTTTTPNDNNQFKGYAHECLILLKPSCFLFPSLVVRCYCNCLHRSIAQLRLVRKNQLLVVLFFFVAALCFLLSFWMNKTSETVARRFVCYLCRWLFKVFLQKNFFFNFFLSPTDENNY